MQLRVTNLYYDAIVLQLNVNHNSDHIFAKGPLTHFFVRDVTLVRFAL